MNNNNMPTLHQIETGLIAEAMEQLRLQMLNVKSSQVQINAKNHISETWRVLLSKAQVSDRNKPLTDAILYDPTHPVVDVLINLYSYEGFIYKILNHSSRVGDESKLSSMGPYALALSLIINKASQF